jgi:hypothetical protein
VLVRLLVVLSTTGNGKAPGRLAGDTGAVAKESWRWAADIVAVAVVLGEGLTTSCSSCCPELFESRGNVSCAYS